MVFLDEFIATLHDGLDTVIGKRRVLLSGGQKQRVAIARAFLKDAPIIILDEATSALDNKAEAIVQKAIDNLMQDKTVFVIAHRLSTIQNVNKIVVINQGEIVETGTHLIPKDNTYTDAIEQHKDLLKINARYNYRKDYVKELFFKKLVLRGKLRDEIENRLSCLDSNIDKNLILWGNYIDSELINARPLVKLTKDINNYFDNILE